MNLHLLSVLTASESDSQRTEAYLSELASRDSLGGFIANATVLLPQQSSALRIPAPAGWLFRPDAQSIRQANLALQFAADSQAGLLVLFGPMLPSSEAVGTLGEALEIDPHFGIGIPRFFEPLTGDVLPIAPDPAAADGTSLSRRVLALLPDFYILPEILTPCFLIKSLVVSNLSGLDEGNETIAGAFAQYLGRVRRAGFRTVVSNHSAVSAPVALEARHVLASKSDIRKLHAEHPDAGKAKTELASHSLHLHERLLGRLVSRQGASRKTLLLDIRGVPKFINGTAEAVLALCDGIRALNTDWNTSLLAEAAAIEHHGLERRFESWRVLSSHGRQLYTVAFRPSQPWHLSTMIELHRMALLNYYAMLDTISWDILFEAPRGLGAFWDFMSQHADGLLYNSFETRNHVLRRFPSAAERPDYVFHHSFQPNDYVHPTLLDLNRPGEYIFVIGNEYDHKHLAPTVDLLSSAFPLQPIKVLGLKSHPNPRVTTLESGRVPAAEVEELFAHARLLVFPSFYEGFGLPVLKGLSYGRTVIARNSTLLDELAANYRGPGRLISYADPVELVDSVGRVIHDRPISEVTLSSGLHPGQKPKTWQDVARGILEFFEQQIEAADGNRWMQRERVIRQLDAFCT